MEEWVSISNAWFTDYIDSFKELTPVQKRNFEYKREHSARVAEMSLFIAKKLELSEQLCHIAYLAGLFHDVGRFQQQIQYETFSDGNSEDHGDLGVKILQEASVLNKFDSVKKNMIFLAVQNHNKYMIQEGLSEIEMLIAKLVRDADKLDIYKVVAGFYPDKKNIANHVFSSNLPKGIAVSPMVSKEVLSGKMVSKNNILSELDMKIMQLSWVYDINFRPSIDILIRNRYLETIYNSLPKNDMTIDIYRKIKVFSENKIMVS